MMGHIFGEFLGVLIIVAFGEGVVANITLEKTIGHNAGSLYAQTAWGLAVMFGVTASLAVGGVGQLNPVFTIMAALISGDYSEVLPFIVAQMAGGFCGAALVWLLYLPHWGLADNPAGTLGVFCTAPGVRNLPLNGLTEFLATLILCVLASAIASKGFAGTNGLPQGFGTYLVGMLIWGIGMSFGGPTGYALNPARDLAPRLAHAILPIEGKGGSDWGYAIVPVVGPMAAGVVAAGLVKLIGLA
jgi:glycerol uptake facilitator protein